MKYLLFLTFALVSCEYFPGDRDFTLTITQYVDNEIRLDADPGYEILVTVVETNINSAVGDYLLIKQGDNIEDDGTGVVFTDRITKNQTFILQSNEMYIKLKLTDGTTVSSPYAVIGYRTIGTKLEVVITEPPSTEEPLPTPNNDDKIYFTTYLENSTVVNDEFVENLKNCIVNMAIEYVEMQSGWILEKEITTNNVIINELRMCQYNWANSENCLELKFALPIVLKDVTDYELIEEHLEEMWNKTSTKYLIDGVKNYKFQDAIEATVDWILVFCSVIVVVILCYCAYVFYLYMLRERRRKEIAKRSDEKPAIDNLYNLPHNKANEPVFEPPMHFANNYNELEEAKAYISEYEPSDDEHYATANLGYIHD